MNKFKLLFIASIALVLAGCGGNDYEGTWKMSGETMGMVSDVGTMVIGSDYVEVNGSRVAVDFEIREIGGAKYLVFKDSKTGTEGDVYKIIDANTLEFSGSMIKVTLSRV